MLKINIAAKKFLSNYCLKIISINMHDLLRRIKYTFFCPWNFMLKKLLLSLSTGSLLSMIKGLCFMNTWKYLRKMSQCDTDFKVCCMRAARCHRNDEIINLWRPEAILKLNIKWFSMAVDFFKSLFNKRSVSAVTVFSDGSPDAGCYYILSMVLWWLINTAV